MRIVVTEYPKSGGTWLVSLLGDALELPKRDIYVSDAHPFIRGDRGSFNLRKHPWFLDGLNLTDACVIKSHEFPNSALINFPACFLHLVRDGRDVIVSKFFYESDFCVLNGIYEKFDISFDDYVPRVAVEWRNYVTAWLAIEVPVYKYEDLLQDPRGVLNRILTKLGHTIPDSRLDAVVQANTKDKLRQALTATAQHNTFVRKGIAGDWQNYFNAAHARAFKELAGDLLVRLGYERDQNW